MRIVIVTDAWFPQPNGVVRVLHALSETLKTRGHGVLVVSPDLFINVPCPTYPEIRLALFAGKRVIGMLEEFAPEVIHIATEGPLGQVARKICLTRGWPFSTAYHTKFPEYIHARTRLPLRWLYRRMRVFHAPSRAVMAPAPCIFRELRNKNFDNVKLWSHGVNTETFHPRDKNHLFGKYALRRPVHLYVGRVTVEKNLPLFLDLDLPGSKVVVGSGPMRDALIKRYPDVHFHTAENDRELSLCYASGDVFVFPSKTDTFGLVMLEALATGVPVAALPVTGPLDVLGMDGPGETEVGCLDDDLAKAAAIALNKSPKACREYAKRFSWEVVCDQFLDFLTPIERDAA